MSRPQSILIFLPDGSPRSVKIAEITNRVVKAVLIPRNKLDFFGQRDEVKGVGLYFLFGESLEKAKPIVYIGEAEDGFVVFKGSEAHLNTAPSCHDYLVTLREKLLKDAILQQKDDKLIFSEDYIFNSPSTAGGVVLGRSTNGWREWKNRDGKALDELKRK